MHLLNKCETCDKNRRELTVLAINSLFLLCEVFADAKVKLCYAELSCVAYARSEVKLAHHFATRRNFTH